MLRPDDGSAVKVAIGLALVGAYLLLRTVDAPETVRVAWIVAAAGVTVLAPVTGLTVLASIGPFTEALTDDGRITAVPFLLAALGAGLLLGLGRDAIARRVFRPTLPVILAVSLFAATLVAVGVTAASFGAARGADALRLWVPGIGGGLTVLAAAWLFATRGERRPVLVAVGSIALAALLSITDVAGAGVVREGLLGWLLRSDVGPERLTGIIPAPNAAAAIFLVALSVTAAAAIFGQRPPVRVLAGALSVVLGGAVALTYSRSGLLALAVIGLILAWAYRRWLGVGAVVAAGLTVGLAALFVPGLEVTRDVPAWADADRVAAWSASIAMWQDAPLLGHGFRSFEWLHALYGSALDAPHNEWLRFFAEGGLLAGLAAAGFVLSALGALLRPRRPAIAGYAAATASLVVMASFNNPFLYAQVTVPAFLIIGTGLGMAVERSPCGGQRSAKAPLVGA